MLVVESQGEVCGIAVVEGIEGDSTLICTSRTGQPWSFLSDDAAM